MQLQLHKNTILFTLILFLFTSTSSIFCALPDKHDSHQEKSSAIAQALAKQKNKLQDLADKAKESQPNAEQELLPNNDANEKDATATPPAKSHTLRNVLIGASLIAAALVWAIIEDEREAERRRQQREDEYWRRVRLEVPAAPQQNQFAWPNQAPEQIHAEAELGPRSECGICLEERPLIRLHCGHSYCRECLQRNLQHARNNALERFDMINCPDQPIGGCTETINRNDIANITSNDTIMLGAYERAHQQRLNPVPVNMEHMDAADAEYIYQHVRPCPRCHQGVERNEGCNHMTCRCGHQFCYNCLLDYNGHTHAYPNCGAGIYGAEAHIPTYHR